LIDNLQAAMKSPAPNVARNPPFEPVKKIAMRQQKIAMPIKALPRAGTNEGCLALGIEPNKANPVMAPMPK